MKSITSVILIALCFSVSTLYAQEENNHSNISFKLFLNGRYQHSEELDEGLRYDNKYAEDKYTVEGLSFAVEIDKGGFFTQEFELMPIDYEQWNNEYTIVSDNNEEFIASGEKARSIHSYFRYSLNHYFLNERRLNPYLGFSSKLYYESLFTKPKIIGAGKYTTAKRYIGIDLGLSTGLRVNLKSNIAIECSAIWSGFDIWGNHQRTDNPLATLDNQKQLNFENQAWKGLTHARLGVCYLFN